MNLYDLTVMEDGTLRLFGEAFDESWEECVCGFWDSTDGGETWELTVELPELENRSVVTTALCEDGTGALIYVESFWEEEEVAVGTDEDALTESDSAEEETGSESTSFFWGIDEMGEMTVEYRLITFDETGVTGEVLLSGEYYGSLFYSRDGDLFYCEYYDSVYQLDPETGETRMEYPIANQAEAIFAATACGSELVVVTDGSVLRYDIASGEMLGEDVALAEAIFVDFSAASTIVMTEDADGRLFYATSDGIYTHQMDGSVVEQVADGGLNSLSEPGCTLDTLVVSGDVFYTIYFNSGMDSNSSESSYGIRKYEYSADASSVPENELTIWSLNEDEGIRQSIYLYQKDHPDTYITYEVGITEENGVTELDAIEESVRSGYSSVRQQEMTYEQMELTLKKLQALKEAGGKVYAAADGLITKINLTVGEKTSDGSAIMMADTSKGFRFTAELIKEEQQYIGAGDLVTLIGTNNKLENLTVDSVTADEEQEDVYNIVVQVPDDTFDLGAAVTLEFTKKSETYSVCVPLAALYLDENNQPYVLVTDEYETVMGTETRVRSLSVVVLEKDSSYAALEEGALSTSQQVITGSDKSLSDGSRVRVE